ncbi:MAG: hypothetical protein WC725_04895 [Patescibacteria group bacterium]|jgi:hypothetical protein
MTGDCTQISTELLEIQCPACGNTQEYNWNGKNIFGTTKCDNIECDEIFRFQYHPEKLKKAA